MQLSHPGAAEERPLRLVELEPPEPGPEELRIKVRTCGVCHTDLHEVEGDLPLPKLPIIPGHEVIGTVDRLGEGVEHPAVGTRVGVPWLYSTCRRCSYCRSGRENLCDDITFTGYTVDGGYAEYLVVGREFCYPIPERFGDVEAAPLLCAGVIGYRALRLSEVRPGQRLGLYGFGASAHICLQVARHWNCQVAVFTRSQQHRDLAAGLGADWVGDADEIPPWRLDSSVIFAPAGELVPKALAALDKGGTLALGGIHMSPIPELAYESVYQERTVRSVANSTRQDVRELLELAARIGLRTTVEGFDLEQANEALLAVKHSGTRAAAVLAVSRSIQTL